MSLTVEELRYTASLSIPIIHWYDVAFTENVRSVSWYMVYTVRCHVAVG